MPVPADFVIVANVDATPEEIAAAAEDVVANLPTDETTGCWDTETPVHIRFDNLHEGPGLSCFASYLGYLAIILEDAGREDAIALIRENIASARRDYDYRNGPLFVAYEIIDSIVGRSHCGLSEMPRNTIRLLRRAIENLEANGGELNEAYADLLRNIELRAAALTEGMTRRDAEIRATAEIPEYRQALRVAYMTLATAIVYDD